VRETCSPRGIIAETKTALGAMWNVVVFCRSHRYRLLVLALLSPIASIPPLVTPLVTQLLIDKAYPARDFLLLGWLCGALLSLEILSNAFSLLSGYLTTHIQCQLDHKLSLRVFHAIQRLPQSYREKRGSGVFLMRAGRDVQMVTQSVMQLLPQVATIVFTFLVAIPLMMRLSVRITLVVLFVIPINYLITARLTGRLMLLNEATLALAEKTMTFIHETIDGAVVSRLFSLDHVRRKRYGQLVRERVHLAFTRWRTGTFWSHMVNLINATWNAVLLFGGWYLVFSDRLELGGAVALGMYIGVLTRPFVQLGHLYRGLLTDSVVARRLLEVLTLRQAAIPQGPQKMFSAPPRRYELRKLSFGYEPGRHCLHNLDLTLQTGHTVAVVGPTGGGKSTLIRILCGLDDRYEGKFLVDGHDFRTVNRDSHLRHISVVPQTAFFFSGSIRDNLCPHKGSISREHLQECVTMLGMDTMLASMPEGYDTKLGWEGVRLSAGQYQKLAALRAILKNASLLLLDEVTASMDIESERNLLQGIVALRPPGCITVLITHHICITTEPWIDQIVVLVDGRIVEKGSFVELEERDGFYHHWVNLSQGAHAASAARAAPRDVNAENRLAFRGPKHVEDQGFAGDSIAGRH
jgi:ABC-type bacteriocin/lantibiotic exporter with double-glycine peptidase domain